MAAGAAQTFVGLVLLRLLFAAMGFGLPLGFVALAIDDPGDGSAGQTIGIVAFGAFCVATGYAAMALAAERLVVDDAGVHRRNPLWRDRSTAWAAIRSVRVETDGHNTHPALETLDGKVIRLRAAASLLDTEGCTARRAERAIAERLA